MSLELYLAYVLACAVITLIPGPTVTVIIANSLAHGPRAGLLNVAGTQLGLALMMAILVVGLSSVIAAMGWLFDWLRWAGAAYLVWLGIQLLRSPEMIHQEKARTVPRGGFFLQGFLVLMANPKALLWFGAFIPQFVDPKGNYVGQIILLGVTAMAVALLSDGAYAVLTGRAGAFLSKRRIRLVSRLSGGFLIGGGIWLALTRGRSNASMQLPPAVVRHLIKALEAEVTRLDKIADTIGDGDWPHDYDPNDLALFRGGLSSLRETAARGASQEWACNKPCRFMMGLLPGYVGQHLASLPESEYSAIFHAYADFLNREVIRRLASFPDRAPK